MVTRREFTESIDKKDGPRSQPKFNEDTSKNVTAGHPIEDRDVVLREKAKKTTMVHPATTVRVDEHEREVAESIPEELLSDVLSVGVEEVPESSPVIYPEEPVEKSIDEQIADLEAQKAELEKE